MYRATRRSAAAGAAALGFALLAATGALAQDDTEGEKVLRSTSGYARDFPTRDATAVQLEETHIKPAERIAKPRASAAVAAATAADQWIYEADAEIYDDFDEDGYYRFISVRFDADTYLDSSWVYAMLFLSSDGETWEHFHTTDDFLIEGSTSLDEYYVETELVTGYPPGLYDVLIELYDADLGVFVDDYGPAESSSLSLLPLEDADSDKPQIVVTITQEHGGGATGIGFLGLLLGGAVLARRRAA
jgi:hypothetical protein